MINTKIADRFAREEVWIKGGMSSDESIDTLPVGDIPAGVYDPIEFLHCNGIEVGSTRNFKTLLL